jgi:hypothetical protein
MLAALENKDNVTAAKELLNSKWKNDVGPERANELAENLRTGIRK